MCRIPGPGQCLFYTEAQTALARSFVQQPNKFGLTMTLWVREENFVTEFRITVANIDRSIRTRGRTSITTWLMTLRTCSEILFIWQETPKLFQNQYMSKAVDTSTLFRCPKHLLWHAADRPWS